MIEGRMAEDRITVGRMLGVKGIVGNMMTCYRVAEDRISGNRMAEMRFQGVGWKGAGDGRMIVSGAEGAYDREQDDRNNIAEVRVG